MTGLHLLPLAGLALVDSTSFGTLGIPVALLVRSRVHVTAFLGYLGVLAGFYWVLGIALVLGADTALRALGGVADSAPVVWAQLAIGVALFVVSFLVDGPATRRRQERRARAGAPATPTRRERWLAALTGDDTRPPRASVVVGAALGAGLVEAASMLPYLGAIGLITAARPGPAGTATLLGGYVAVMIAPALVLLALRLLARRAVDPVLSRLGAWMNRNSADVLGWVLGIVGFLLAADAVSRLGLIR
ncbi:GAP family protein [Mobilicoccus sp.]|uniref:GAP family protein n=1 Tax=Mobilicoccus sp. TaxID=2034349 RepID=UPI0028A9D73D|nr:GAP family protein [Mobilicoccus sp.]